MKVPFSLYNYSSALSQNEQLQTNSKQQQNKLEAVQQKKARLADLKDKIKSGSISDDEAAKELESIKRENPPTTYNRKGLINRQFELTDSGKVKIRSKEELRSYILTQS